MCMCVSLYHVIQSLFPQQLRLRGPSRPRLPPHRPLLSFAEETGTEKWSTEASAGKFPPYGFLRIGIYVLGLVWLYFFYSIFRNDGSFHKKLEWFVEPCKVRGELLFAFFFRSLLKPVASFYGFSEELDGFSTFIMQMHSSVDPYIIWSVSHRPSAFFAPPHANLVSEVAF